MITPGLLSITLNANNGMHAPKNEVHVIDAKRARNRSYVTNSEDLPQSQIPIPTNKQERRSSNQSFFLLSGMDRVSINNGHYRSTKRTTFST